MNADIKEIETRILNFVRTNNGYTIDQVSRVLNIPINFVNTAVMNLKKQGLLQATGTLKIGRRIG